MKKRIKLYTHTDLDGYGCSILLKIFLSANYDIEVTYLDYSDIKNTDFKKDIEKYEKYLHQHTELRYFNN